MKGDRVRAEDIVQKARDRAGIEHFDSESFREGLEHAAAGVDLHPLRTAGGKAFLEELYVGNLVKRLKVADWARRHPDVTQAKIERPVFVMGLPRTGTTLVSYLLAADRKRRSLLVWEADEPVPPPTTASLYDNPILDARRAHALNDNNKHHEEADGPTECTFVIAHDFKSLFVEAMTASTDYARWILETDMRSAYDYHKLFLQVLQSQAPGSWNLKMPAHTVFVEALLATYPDARIIWTHRDPFTVAGSLFSLISSGQSLSLSETDRAHIAATYPYQLHEHARRPMAVMDRLPNDPFYHLQYNAMMRDPIGEIRKLFAWLGDDFAPDTEQAMRDYLAANPQGKFGKHAYSLDQFGFSKASLTPYFEDYIARFDIELEG